MRVLIINSEYPPVGAGAGNASANIARLLVRLGNEVTVVTAGSGRLPKDEAVDGVRILRGPASRKRVDRSTALEQVVFILGASYRCLGLMRGFRPHATLAFFGLPSGAVAWFLKWIFAIPYVVSLRGGDVPGFRPYDFWLYHRIAVPFLRVIWHGAEAVIANSRGLRDLAKGFDESLDIPIIPNGVDIELFTSEGRDWNAAGVLSVGRVVHQKGLDLGLMALADLKDLAWEWRIVGDGPQVAYLRETLAREGLEHRVQIIGWAGPAELVAEYRRASLFVFPSRHEGMPNAVLEAMASGLPVIATQIAGNEELVVPGETGILVPPDDPDALREALRGLLVDASERERMGRAARRRVEADFRWETTTAGYLAILERAAR
jgi:glycosyltransferase involved in cell wall biosynthesis